MTAEIAVLNKSAVALAADSAVTISSNQAGAHKVYNNGDKLFELSTKNPIGIMVFNNADFMGIPISVLIRDFRSQNNTFKKTSEAASKFLDYLYNKCKNSPENVIEQTIYSEIGEIIDVVISGTRKRILDAIENAGAESTEDSFDDIRNNALSKELDVLESAIHDLPNTKTYKNKSITFTESEKEFISKVVESDFDAYSNDLRERLKSLLMDSITKSNRMDNRLGIVIAGFGDDDLFPSLVSFQITGIIGGALKFGDEYDVDIDRAGDKAKVLPFAQKDMVERFLFGLDDTTRKQISTITAAALPDLHEKILELINFDTEENEAEFREIVANLENEFQDRLRKEAFGLLQDQSRNEIESMVEFMPKAELAQMAEALVELTSIKRRVTIGLETVAPPIDVALITKSEGFVWIKRKHYFPADLNSRYFARMNS